ncbi:Leucine-Rich Repeats And Immunoglobulin-Like Domains Protein 1 [Manis pentadactyla]|nr:Leucine-Rich Repeats And Immunoglobulin-Like Domains Protein 1 [Manis pentadactyla]
MRCRAGSPSSADSCLLCLFPWVQLVSQLLFVLPENSKHCHQPPSVGRCCPELLCEVRAVGDHLGTPGGLLTRNGDLGGLWVEPGWTRAAGQAISNLMPTANLVLLWLHITACPDFQPGWTELSTAGGELTAGTDGPLALHPWGCCCRPMWPGAAFEERGPYWGLPSSAAPALAHHGLLATSTSAPPLFSVLCLAASSPRLLPPPGSSSLSCRGPDSSSSPRSPWLSLGSGSDRRPGVSLLPPFLSDQAQHVHALGAFHLFCQATGPADVHFVWEKNGQDLETCVPVQTHTLPGGRAHALSWLRDTIRESAEYSCSARSSAGNKTSRVRVTVARHDATHQEKWTRELAAWRAVVGEHDHMMHNWREAWERCNKDIL